MNVSMVLNHFNQWDNASPVGIIVFNCLEDVCVASKKIIFPGSILSRMTTTTVDLMSFFLLHGSSVEFVGKYIFC